MTARAREDTTTKELSVSKKLLKDINLANLSKGQLLALLLAWLAIVAFDSIDNNRRERFHSPIPPYKFILPDKGEWQE